MLTSTAGCPTQRKRISRRRITPGKPTIPQPRKRTSLLCRNRKQAAYGLAVRARGHVQHRPEPDGCSALGNLHRIADALVSTREKVFDFSVDERREFVSAGVYGSARLICSACSRSKQPFLYFLPLPQGHGSFRE